MTTDLFDLAVALLTVRRRTDVVVNVPGLTAAGPGIPAAAAWTRLLDDVEHEITTAGGESTTETADIALVRRTRSYGQFVLDHPDIVQRVRTVTTIRESMIEETPEH